MKKGVDYIGVTCVFYCHDGKGNFVLHRRSKDCKDEQGLWDVGGGSLEHGESWEEALKREVKEEYCTQVLDIKFVQARNVLRQVKGDRTHWIALLFLVEVVADKVKIGEPLKMDEIGWFKWGEFPTPLHSQIPYQLEDVGKFIATNPETFLP